MKNNEAEFIKKIILEIEELKIKFFTDEENWFAIISNPDKLKNSLVEIERAYRSELIIIQLMKKEEKNAKQYLEDNSLLFIAYKTLIESFRERIKNLEKNYSASEAEYKTLLYEEISERYLDLITPNLFESNTKRLKRLFKDYPNFKEVWEDPEFQIILEKAQKKLNEAIKSKTEIKSLIDPIRIINSSSVFETIDMPFDDIDFKRKICHVMYSELKNYLDISEDEFTRHFIASDTPIYQTPWKGSDREIAQLFYWLDTKSIIIVDDYIKVIEKHFLKSDGRTFNLGGLRVAKSKSDIDKYPIINRVIEKLDKLKNDQKNKN